MSVGGESITIEDAIKARLSSTVAVTDIVGDRIWPDLAPQNAEYPFIVFQQQVTTDVVGVGPRARIMVNAEWIVRGVSEISTYGGLKALARAIDGALEGLTLDAIDGYVFACVRQNEYRMTEQHEGRTIRHLGGQFKLQAQTTA